MRLSAARNNPSVISEQSDSPTRASNPLDIYWDKGICISGSPRGIQDFYGAYSSEQVLI